MESYKSTTRPPTYASSSFSLGYHLSVYYSSSTRFQAGSSSLPFSFIHFPSLARRRPTILRIFCEYPRSNQHSFNLSRIFLQDRKGFLHCRFTRYGPSHSRCSHRGPQCHCLSDNGIQLTSFIVLPPHCLCHNLIHGFDSPPVCSATYSPHLLPFPFPSLPTTNHHHTTIL